MPAHEKTCDVVIIGAGIVGACSALSLLQRGKTVCLIDKDEPCQGASYGNAGIISPWSFIPQSLPGIWKKIPGWILDPDGPVALKPSHIPRFLPWGMRFLSNCNLKTVNQLIPPMQLLTAPSIDLYRNHLAGTGQESLIQDSFYVHAFRDVRRANLDAIDYRIRKQSGCDIDCIYQGDLQTLEPALSNEFKAAILIKGQARALSPGGIGKTLVKKVTAHGGRLVKGYVTSLTRNQQDIWHVQTSDCAYMARTVLITAGAWSARLLKQFGYTLPLEAERGYHINFANPGITLTHSVMDVDNRIVASSMLDGVRVAGTTEFAGLDAPENPKRYKTLEKQAKRMLPTIEMGQPSYWMGMRPSFPDGLPVLGEFSNHKGLFASFGHSHYGLMMAPKSGELIADMISNKPLNIDLSALATNRF